MQDSNTTPPPPRGAKVRLGFCQEETAGALHIPGWIQGVTMFFGCRGNIPPFRGFLGKGATLIWEVSEH
jgi:hypothetical protein